MTAAELYELGKLFFPPPPAPCFFISDASNAPASSGVYFIYRNGVCVYVGESIDIRNRLRCHEKAQPGDCVGVIECHASQRRRLESFYVGLLDPPLNAVSTSRKPVVFRQGLHGKRRSLARMMWEYLQQHKACSLSDLRRCGGGWKHKSANAAETLRRMEEWGFIEIFKEMTAGRSRTVICARAATTRCVE